MNPLAAYFAILLAFVLGYWIGHRFGSRPNDERYNRGWLDGYDIARNMPTTTSNASFTPATVTPKKAPAKITANKTPKRKAKS